MQETEKRNPNSMNVDKLDSLGIINVMQSENEFAINAVRSCIPQIEKVIDGIFAHFKEGGRIIFVGCGTSGRLGVIDAVECPPTFGLPPERVVGIIAGGEKRMVLASESEEDNGEAGRRDIEKHKLQRQDCVIGISAAGYAEYVLSAIDYAKEVGCLTACITNNKDTALSKRVDCPIECLTGAEVITGSTRLKAATAQKVILNMITTSIMIKMGYVYENLMVNVKPLNKKLRERAINIFMAITNSSEETAINYLENSDWVIKRAVEKMKEEK